MALSAKITIGTTITKIESLDTRDDVRPNEYSVFIDLCDKHGVVMAQHHMTPSSARSVASALMACANRIEKQLEEM